MDSNGNTKSLASYIHLYIGCEAKAEIIYQEKGAQWVSCKLVGITNGIPIVRCRDIHGKDWGHDSQVSNVKPILRPLSDMTEEDFNELSKSFFMTDKIVFGNDGSYWYACDRQLFHWLLSRGFDLFGLIDADLAINANTQNQTN